LNRDKATGPTISLKVGVIVALVITLGFLILCAGLRAAEKPIGITADNLMAEYQKDEIAADARYKDNLLAVTGVVFKVVRDTGGIAYVTLVTGDMVSTIQCFFEKGDDTILATIGSGIKVTVIGRGDGNVKGGNVFLKKCVLKAQVVKTKDAVLGFFSLGKTYLGLGNYQQAIEDFDRAIELDPEFAEAYWGRGKTYHGLGNYQRAIEDFNRAIELDPEFAEVYWDRGKTYNELGSRQQALEDWKAAAKLGNEQAQDILKSKEIKW